MTTPGSTAAGDWVWVTPVFATSSLSIHFEASSASIAATSDRAARSCTSVVPPRVKITFATQNERYGTPRLWRSLVSGACVCAACSFSVRYTYQPRAFSFWIPYAALTSAWLFR